MNDATKDEAKQDKHFDLIEGDRLSEYHRKQREEFLKKPKQPWDDREQDVDPKHR